ncbi:MAG: hypothetical protein ACMXYE_03220 [Candidatus Woesearchaeota archaeon]
MQFPFVTSFDTNNDGKYETVSFYGDSIGRHSRVILEDGSFFDGSIIGLRDGFACYEDLTGNGNFDLLVAGWNTTPQRGLYLYENNNGTFTLSTTFDVGFSRGSCHISRFLENNETNILITGINASGPITRQILLFNSTENLLDGLPDPATNERLANIPPLSESDIFVADFDDDGFKDILICGNDGAHPQTYFLKQNASRPGYFYRQNLSFENYERCSITATHLPHSQGLAVAIGGKDEDIRVYTNTPPFERDAPSPPTNLNISYNHGTQQLFVSWDAVHPMYSYNLKASYLDGEVIVADFYPLSTHPAQGYLGNMRYRTNVTLNNVTSEFVSVSVQTFDQSLRKSEWTTLSSSCEPTESEWIISSHCPLTTNISTSHNITVNSTGFLDIQIPNFSSPHSNLTVQGRFSAQSFTVNSFTYNGTENLTGLFTQSPSFILSEISIFNSTFTNITTANATFYDSNVTLFGNATLYTTTTFTYTDQFGNVTEVNQSLTNSTQTKHILLSRIFPGNIPINHSITFSKYAYYNTTQVIFPAPSVLVSLTRSPLPLSTFPVGTSFSENMLTNNMETDLAFFSSFNLTLGNEFGRINWTQPINISFLNLDEVVSIGNNTISSTLNGTADLVFYNLSYVEKPLLLRNEIYCEECTNKSYNGSAYFVSVPGFSNYTTTANAVVTYASTSLIITDEEHEIKVLYSYAINGSGIPDAVCTFNSTVINLDLIFDGEFYTANHNFSIEQEFNASIHCDAENYEPISILEELRVVGDGKFFLRSGVYDGVRLSSAGLFNNSIYYHGYRGTDLYFRYKDNVLINSKTNNNEPQLPFALTDLNNNGVMQKIILGETQPVHSFDSGSFVAVDVDNDGDTDIIFCADGKFGVLRNSYAGSYDSQNVDFSTHNFFDVTSCNMAYTNHNNAHYVALQGNIDGDLQLKVIKLNSATNYTNVSTTDGLQSGELVFVDINNDGYPEIISTGYITNEEADPQVNIYTIRENELVEFDFQITEIYSFTSITSTTLPGEEYPIIFISGQNISGQNHVNFYQFNGTTISKRNELMGDVTPFTRGSAFFGDVTGNNVPDLFTAGSNNAQLFNFIDTDNPVLPPQPNPPNFTVSYNHATKQTTIDVDADTYMIRIGDKHNANRFVSGAVGTSTNPTHYPYRSGPFVLNINHICQVIQVKKVTPSHAKSGWSEPYELSFDESIYNKEGFDGNCDGIPYSASSTTTGSGGSGGFGGTQGNNNGEPSTSETTNDVVIPPVEQTSSESGGSIQQEPEPEPEPQPEQRTFEQFFEINYRNGNTEVIETIQNNERTFKTSVVLRKEFDTDVLAHASLLTSRAPFTIIRENPIIDFSLPNLDYLQQYRLSYTLPGEIPKERIHKQHTELHALTHLTAEEIQEIERQQMQLANESLQTTFSESIVNNQTVLTVRLDLQEGVDTVRDIEVEQFIPKCLIEEVNEIILRAGIDERFIRDVTIKEADPIIVWNFKELNASQEFSFTLPVLRDEDCEDEVLITTLARDFIGSAYEINPRNLYASFGLTAGIIFVFLLLFSIVIYQGRDDIEYIITQQLKHGNTPEQIQKNFKENRDIDISLERIKNHKVSAFHHVTERGVEILIFITLLILNALEFAGALDGYLDWAKKVISILLLLLLLYKVDLMKVLFNHSKVWLSLTILFAMLLMHLKNLVQFANNLRFEVRALFIFDFYQWILEHQYHFSVTLFVVGAVMLILISLYIGFFHDIREGSLFFTLSRHPHAHTFFQKLRRSFFTMLILFVFFFSIFNRILEWLAIAIDAAVFMLAVVILVTGILHLKFINHKSKKTHSIYQMIGGHATLFVLGLWYLASLFVPLVSPLHGQIIIFSLLGLMALILFIAVWITRRHHFQELKHVSTAVDTIYVKFVKLFTYPHTLILGVTGLLVLQHIVEIGLYIIPNITGHGTELYSQIEHATIFSLFGHESITAEHLFFLAMHEKVAFGALYLIALLGYIFLFSIPAIVWVIYFLNRGQHFTNVGISEKIKEHSIVGATLRNLSVFGIPLIGIALVSNILHVQVITNLFTVGIEMTAHKTTVTLTTIIALFATSLLFSAVAYTQRKKPYIAYITIWLGIITLSVFYMLPYIQSTIYYIRATFSMPTGFESTLAFFITLFFALDLFIIYGLGLFGIILLSLPRKVKKTFINLISKRGPLHRMNALSQHMIHLDYFDDATHHITGNLLDYVKHYIRAEEKQGNHLEMIVYQLKIHQYPDKLIHKALHDLAREKGFIHDSTHLSPEHIDIDSVKHLIPLIRKELKRRETTLEIYEEFQDEYSFAEIKLALRLATNSIKGHITKDSIKYAELQQLKEIIHYLEKRDSLEEFTFKGYDPALMELKKNARNHTFHGKKAQELTVILEDWMVKKEPLEKIYEVVKHYSGKEILYACNYLEKHKDEKDKWEHQIKKIQGMIDWIHRAEKKGMTRDKIYESLIKIGYSKKYIDLAMHGIDAHHIFIQMKK